MGVESLLSATGLLDEAGGKALPLPVLPPFPALFGAVSVWTACSPEYRLSLTTLVQSRSQWSCNLTPV